MVISTFSKIHQTELTLRQQYKMKNNSTSGETDGADTDKKVNSDDVVDDNAKITIKAGEKIDVSF